MNHNNFWPFSLGSSEEMVTVRSLLGSVCLLVPYTASAFTLLPVIYDNGTSRRIRLYGRDGNVLHRKRKMESAVQVSLSSSWSFSEEEQDKKKNKKSAVEDLMNRYSFDSLESIAAEWTAVVKAGSSLQRAGIYMEPRNTKINVADLVTVRFPRTAGGGLGLELLELAGGREDGRGITVVEAVVPGGPADGVGLLPGDTLVDITVESSSSSSSTTAMNTESTTLSVDLVELECLSFDATVAAIRSLPPPRVVDVSDTTTTTTETMIVTVKRLRRRPKVQVKLHYPESDSNDETTNQSTTTTLELFCGENLRRALLVRGVKVNDPLARRFDSGGSGDCGADGTCATCAIAVVQGMDLLTAPTTMERQIFRDRLTWRMSCKTQIGMQEGELTICVNPRQW